jgi:lipid-A-disaccharide synthase
MPTLQTSQTPINPSNILLVAGETSGDILAAHLLQGLRRQGCDLPVWGVGGPKLSALGMDCVESIDALAVRGYTEVLGALPRLWHLRRRLMAQAAQRRPSLCITVDAPDFNLGLAAKMKALGVPTLHFISPSIWAWRRERLQGIQAAVDTMLCVFPHEPPLYQSVGMSAQYVGHPMAQTIPLHIDKATAKAALHVSAQHRLIALLPGSRAAELKHILPRQLAASVQLSARDSSLRFVLPVASDALMAQAQTVLASYPQLPIQLLRGQAGLALAAADVALIASGTATLEAALYKLPMVICYAMPHTSWLMMRRKNYLPWVGLPNILCQDWVVPEYLQDAATPTALADAVWALLGDAPRCEAIAQRFAALHHTLRCDTQSLAARAVLRCLR